MPRYIDADALLKIAYDYIPVGIVGRQERLLFAEGLINNAPTVSPDEVRGVGEWIRQEKAHPNCPEDSDYRYECSVCGWSDQHNAKMIVPFCWHCGARMKGAEDGD